MWSKQNPDSKTKEIKEKALNMNKDKNFKASKGWLQKFLKRNKISKIKKKLNKN